MNNEEWKPMILNMSVEYQEVNGFFWIHTTTESEKIFGLHVCSTGRTLDEARDEFFGMIKDNNVHAAKRSYELDLWKPFQKEPSFIIIFGLFFQLVPFMGIGFKIPFTKKKILFRNYWKRVKISVKY